MLLDTSGLLALLDAREPFHRSAVDQYRQATSRVTHALVLGEFVALANVRGVPSSSVLPFLTSLLANPDIDTVYPDQAMLSQAVALLIARQGRGYSLCDAISFVLMRARGDTDALSTDHHFDDEGFRRLLASS
jgi:predicted nucleic acid-binding protein